MKEIQKNRITIISRNEYQRADIETKSKQFYFEDNHIHYENKLQIVENTQSKINGINVVNNLCQVQNNKLVKTTVVYFEDKLIRIEDEFYLQNYSHNVKVENQSTIIKKPITNMNLPQIIPLNINDRNGSCISQKLRKKKDLKNIVKNIVKIFMHWVDNALLDSAEDCKKVMNALLESYKYNNSLLKAMSENPVTSKAFLSFLITSGEELISVSRIHDKKTHLDTLKRYQTIFEKRTTNQQRSTSINESVKDEGSEYNKVDNSNQQKYKSQSNSDNNNNMEKMQFGADVNEQNENKESSKGSDSDKLFSNSNSNENRNRSMMSSSNAENYPSGERINSRDNLMFFSSSGSDQ